MHALTPQKSFNSMLTNGGLAHQWSNRKSSGSQYQPRVRGAGFPGSTCRAYFSGLSDRAAGCRMARSHRRRVRRIALWCSHL